MLTLDDLLPPEAEQSDQQELLEGLSWEGMFDAWVALQHRPAVDLQKILPQGVDLVPHDEIPSHLQPPDAGDHPFLWFAGNHHEVKPSRKIPWLPWNLNYLEVGIVIPYVRHGKNGPYVHPRKLYLDNVAAVLFGWMGGANKELGIIDMQRGQSFEAKSIRQSPRFSLRETDRGLLRTEPDHFPVIREVFAFPAIAHYLDARMSPAAYQQGISQFDPAIFPLVTWESRFEIGTDIQATDIECEISPYFLDACSGRVSIPGIDQTSFGSFWMNGCRWSISSPDKLI